MENNKFFKLLEVILMPLVIALVGFIGTKFITKSQIRSSENISSTELTSIEKRSRDEKQLKLLEIFSNKITSKDLNERILAVKLLGLLDPTLSTQLATIVAEDSSENRNVRMAANVIIQNAAKQSSFVDAKSTTDFQVAITFANKIQMNYPKYKTEIFLAENGNYAVTVGSYLDFKSASKIQDTIKLNPIIKDSYIKQSNSMGKNLFSKIKR